MSIKLQVFVGPYILAERVATYEGEELSLVELQSEQEGDLVAALPNYTDEQHTFWFDDQISVGEYDVNLETDLSWFKAKYKHLIEDKQYFVNPELKWGVITYYN